MSFLPGWLLPRFVIVVPARGGSKRAPYKNIRHLGGKPLLAHTLACATAADLGCPVIVSTEDRAVVEVARSYGATVVDRPPELATDIASTESVLLHVLSTMRTKPEWIITLPPTSPFRKGATVRRFTAAIGKHRGELDCLMSLTEDRGDFWIRQEDETLQRLFPDAPRRQQDRQPLYAENSAIYVTRVGALEETGSILGRTVRGLVIDPVEGFDINDERDFLIAEALLKAGSIGALELSRWAK